MPTFFENLPAKEEIFFFYFNFFFFHFNSIIDVLLPLLPNGAGAAIWDLTCVLLLKRLFVKETFCFESKKKLEIENKM